MKKVIANIPKKYIVSWEEKRSITIEAESKEQAEEIVKSGDYDPEDVFSDEITREPEVEVEEK